VKVDRIVIGDLRERVLIRYTLRNVTPRQSLAVGEVYCFEVSRLINTGSI